MSTFPDTQAVPPKPDGSPTADERQWALLAHLSGLLASAIGGMAFLGPLVIWLIKKEQSAFVADQAKEALNFQIAVTIALVVTGVIGMLTCVGFLLLPVIGIGSLIFSIIAAMAANNGVAYRYPYTIRLIT